MTKACEAIRLLAKCNKFLSRLTMGSGVNNARRLSNSVAFAHLAETLIIPPD